MKSQYLKTKSNTENWNSYFYFTLSLCSCVPPEDNIKYSFGFIFFFFKWKAICFNSLLQMGFRRAIDYRAISLKWNITLSKSLWWPSPCWTAYDITSLFHHQAYRAQKNVYLTCQELWQWTKSYAWFRRYWSGDNNCNNVAVYYCTTH